MSSKSASKGGVLPNLRMGKLARPPKGDAQTVERDEIAKKLRQLKADFKRREKLRRDRGRKR